MYAAYILWSRVYNEVVVVVVVVVEKRVCQRWGAAKMYALARNEVREEGVRFKTFRFECSQDIVRTLLEKPPSAQFPSFRATNS